jgi:hypothetical protein
VDVARLYHTLPEAGDLDKPKLVFFFDGAHRLFENASTARAPFPRRRSTTSRRR